jgi:predicted NAD/FAD-binding protein
MGAIVPPTAQALRPAEPVETARVPLSAERVPPRVAIIGGGLAGLACAVGLAGRGLQITLYESRTRLGGRASSFNDPLTGNLVDNCQHVSMSCCTNLTDFCRRVGIDDLFKVVDQITFIDPEGRTTNWKSGPLPAPLHLAGAFAATRFLSLGDKLRIAFGLSCLRFARSSPSQSFYDWLRRHGQSTRTIKRFWETVLVSALNERLDQMDIGHARKVFLDGMMRTREGYRLEIPVVPLGELYGTRLESWLAASGVRLRMNTGVRTR